MSRFLMSVATAWATVACVVFVVVSAVWALGVWLRNASIIDLFWGPLFVISAWALLALAPTPSGAALLVTAMVTLWGLRLAFHLFQRNIGAGEDPRYARWRARGGRWWWLRSYWRINLTQGAIAVVVAAPLVAVYANPPPLGPWQIPWVLLWTLGFTIEALADLQLGRFRADPANRGQVMNVGLWRYSRHPNYFGDALAWWAVAFAAASWQTWWAMIGPVLMTVVLVRLSSALLERAMVETRPGYAAYVASTSAFVPWWPRSSTDGTGPT